MTFEIIVTKEYEGNSPKSFIKKHVDVPYWKIPQLLKDKRITINKKKIKQDTILKEGDVIKVWLNELKPILQTQKENRKIKNLNIEKIYENEDFIILNKKPGIVVQGAQDNELSLSYHLEYLKEKNKDSSSFDYIHAHRIDKDTSGILVVGKNLIALRKLNEIFKNRDVKKKYVCLCLGKFEKKTGTIENWIKRAKQGSKEKAIISNDKSEDAKKAITIFKVLKEIEFENDIFSFVEVEIKTGLMHQIRAHMKYLKHPIIGDSMYGNSFLNKKLENVLKRQFLHAISLEFEWNGKNMKFEAPLADDLKKTVEFLEN